MRCYLLMMLLYKEEKLGWVSGFAIQKQDFISAAYPR